MAIDWKQSILEDTIIDHSIEGPPAEETEHLAAKHYRDQFATHNLAKHEYSYVIR